MAEAIENTQRKQGRYQTLLAAYGVQIHKHIFDGSDGDAQEAIESSFEKFAAADPTADRPHKPHAYLQWMCNVLEEAWSTGAEFGKDDFERLAKNLQHFDDFKKRYKDVPFEKDINQHNDESLQRLVNYIESGAHESSNSKEKAKKLAMFEQSIVYYSGPEGMIVSPLTLTASMHWGQNTQWCTTESDGRQFRNYTSKGPLIIYLPKRLERSRSVKFQASKSASFVNETDSQIESIPENLDLLINAAIAKDDKLTETLFTHGKITIRDIHEENRTPEVCRVAMKMASDDANAKKAIIEGIPNQAWSDETVIQDAIRMNAVAALKAVPSDKLTAQHCFLALSLITDTPNGIFDLFPQRIWENSNFCLIALQKCEDRLALLNKVHPDVWKNEEFCIYAVSNAQSVNVLPQIHPAVWLKQDFCEAALAKVQDKNLVLEFILASAKGMKPPEIKTEQQSGHQPGRRNPF